MSIYTKTKYYPDTDPPELIEQCLNCTKPECIDCIGRAPMDRSYHGNHYKTVDAELFIESYNAGMRRQQMAEVLGISYESVGRRMDWLHLPRHPEDRPTITLENIECLPTWMQHHFTLKGERMA